LKKVSSGYPTTLEVLTMNSTALPARACPGVEPTRLVRRDLLKLAGALSCGLGCGAADGGGGAVPPLIALPAVVGGRITLPVGEYPQLREVGGGLVGRASGMPDPIAVTREQEQRYFAFTAVCTHMACVLSYHALNALLVCPCHGSTFELDGTVLTGPATRSLRPLPTEFDGRLLGVVTG
jgi:cytochrome b6-f complex iron-sulfur subunit